MSRLLENMIMVLLAFTLTGIGVFAVVSNVDVSPVAVASTSATDDLTCPTTGCTAVSCHATASGASTSDDQLQTCPATGCTSYGCHATDGSNEGGHGHGFGQNQTLSDSTTM